MVKHRGVRVIAGSARGRRLVVPPGADVRPTKDMVREAVFSALASRGALVVDAVLDLYAGSGALGIEALSRGASRAVFVEADAPAAGVIAQNLETIGFADRATVVRAEVGRFLAAPPPRGAPFDLVFADPPYATDDADLGPVLDALVAPGFLAPDATVVVERPAGSVIAAPPALPATWERTFGDTLVVFLAL
jgi:16S rRNA (guanine966-N2)-methyltransferase